MCAVFYIQWEFFNKLTHASNPEHEYIFFQMREAEDTQAMLEVQGTSQKTLVMNKSQNNCDMPHTLISTK